jgi:hypothetical protein
MAQAMGITVSDESVRAHPDLTAEEMVRLAFWRARYRMEMAGFSGAESAQLAFLAWRIATSRIGGPSDG